MFTFGAGAANDSWRVTEDDAALLAGVIHITHPFSFSLDILIYLFIHSFYFLNEYRIITQVHVEDK